MLGCGVLGSWGFRVLVFFPKCFLGFSRFTVLKGFMGLWVFGVLSFYGFRVLGSRPLECLRCFGPVVSGGQGSQGFKVSKSLRPMVLEI